MLKIQEPKYDAVPMMLESSGTKLINRATGEAIPDDEPVFIFRARDIHALGILHTYRNVCADEEHQRVIGQRIDDFARFASDHLDRMKEPDSAPL